MNSNNIPSLKELFPNTRQAQTAKDLRELQVEQELYRRETFTSKQKARAFVWDDLFDQYVVVWDDIIDCYGTLS